MTTPGNQAESFSTHDLEQFATSFNGRDLRYLTTDERNDIVNVKRVANNSLDEDRSLGMEHLAQIIMALNIREKQASAENQNGILALQEPWLFIWPPEDSSS